MKYFVENPDGEKVGPFSLSEIVDQFGDNVSLIPADGNAQNSITTYLTLGKKTHPSHPIQLQLTKIPAIDGPMVIAAIALAAAVLGTMSIGFGFFASFDQPEEYQMTHAIFGLLGLLINAVAALVALCGLIARPSIIPTIALAFAILSSAAFLFIPPQTRPKASTRANQVDLASQ